METPPISHPAPAGPCSLVIFGAAGDLTKRLIVPALYNLTCARLLPEHFAIIGVDRAEHDDRSWRESFNEMVRDFVKGSKDHDGVQLNEDAWHWLQSRMSYLKGDLTDDALYSNLSAHLADLDGREQTGHNYLFYLAVSDRFFGTVVDHLGSSGLAHQDGCWRRVVIEKPFGHDLPTARDLNAQIGKTLDETQIYRMDHFLGKETVQNIMMFRFANGIFEPLWNRDRIDHVQITVAETVGVEKRAGYYDKTGALRDMVPNHLFQLVAMTAMEAPNSLRADAVRSEKAKVIESIRMLNCDEVWDNVVRGQYGEGSVNGHALPAYRAEDGVDESSSIETYVAMKLTIDNWRWTGVPFYVRTGKAMSKRRTEIAIKLKGTPEALFRNARVRTPPPNWLVLRIQPDEGISMEFGAKVPGPEVQLGNVRMNFNYEDYFGKAPNTGYETLIYDAMIGDATLFQRADNIELGWQAVQPVLECWDERKPGKFPNYRAGSAGPERADTLLEHDGRRWRSI